MITLAEAAARGWPRIAKERVHDADPKSLDDLIRLMRNGLAHGNLELRQNSSGDGDIGEMRIWNTRAKKGVQGGVRTWGAIVTVRDARTFLLRFTELIDELHAAATLRQPAFLAAARASANFCAVAIWRGSSYALLNVTRYNNTAGDVDVAFRHVGAIPAVEPTAANELPGVGFVAEIAARGRRAAEWSRPLRRSPSS